MAFEVCEDLKSFEDQFFRLRMELQNLKSRASLYLSDNHPTKTSNCFDATTSTIEFISFQTKLALYQLNQYEPFKELYFDQEFSCQHILSLTSNLRTPVNWM